MKSTKKIVTLLALVLVAVVIFTGCSSKFSSVGEYLADASVQAELDKEFAALEGTGVSMEVYADGNTLVYDCKYDVQLEISDEMLHEALVAALEQALEETKDTYIDIAAKLHEVVDAEDITVRVIYLNADGTELYSRDFQ